MTDLQINTEIKNTKLIMENLMSCMKSGKMQFYQEYIDISCYYLKLLQVKPNHNLTIA